MKKREIVQQVAELRRAYVDDVANLDGRVAALQGITERIVMLDESIDNLANRVGEAERLLVDVQMRNEEAVFKLVKARVAKMLEAAERRFDAVDAVRVEAERKAKVLDGMKERMERLNIVDLAKNVAWLLERVAMLSTRLENMRGNVTLDDAAAQRLTFAVGQFAARLDRLEAPKPPRMPRKRPQKPAGPNGGA